MHKNAIRTSEVEGSLILPELAGFDEMEKFCRWKYWSSRLPVSKGNGEPADWLEHPFLDQRGVYLWTLPRTDNKGFRLLHVGCCYGKGSSLRERTLCHYNNYHAFAWHGGRRKVRRLDPLPQFHANGDRDRSRDESDQEGREDNHNRGTSEINAFLEKSVVIYLAPEYAPSVDSPDFKKIRTAVRTLEGAIARAADEKCGGHLTNTLSKTSKCTNIEIAAPVNAIEGIGPLYP